MEISVYTFEDKDGGSVTDWYTQDYKEARAYAIENKCRVIDNTLIQSHSDMVDDFTEDEDGHDCREIYMNCKDCKYVFAEWQGEPTEVPGIRLCPSCGSQETFEVE